MTLILKNAINSVIYICIFLVCNIRKRLINYNILEKNLTIWRKEVKITASYQKEVK